MTDGTRNVDRTALSYWFPLIEKAGLPVPRTKIFKMPAAARDVILAGIDGRDGGDGLLEFSVEMAEAIYADPSMGFPIFLRTDHTSGKHEWDRTCFVRCDEDLPQHIWALCEYSELVDIMGLPWDTIVAREMLPTKPVATCPAYGNMPVTREFRVFVDGGEIICAHAYWPRDVITKGGAYVTPHDYRQISMFRDIAEQEEVRALARRAGVAVGGAWSVDILDTKRGWFVTDMAEAHKSWHWPACEHEARCRKVPA